MIVTSLYIISCTAWNRVRLRLRRLREPRYAVGGIVGAAYVYFSLMRFTTRRGDFPQRRRRGGDPAVLAVLTGAGTALTALLLSAMAAWTWLSFAPGGGLFELSKAEVQFLLPAPVSRRAVLAHRLLRSQLGLLVAAAVPMLIIPTGSGGGRVRIGLTVWIILTTLRLLSAGVTLWRPRLSDGDRRTRFLARLAVVVTASPFVAGAGVLALEFWRAPAARFVDVLGRANDLTRTGVVGSLLYPFATLAAPMFAVDWPAFARSLPGAVAVLGLVGLWVFSSDQAFDAVADTVAAGPRRGSPARVKRYEVRSGPFELSPAGRPELLFFWKAATEAMRAVNLRTVLSIVVPVLVTIAGASLAGLLPRAASETFAILSFFAVAFAMLMGPQALRTDLRTDLAHLALFKTWPVSPSSVIRGELLWPVLVLTSVVWGLAVFAAFMAAAAVPELSLPWRMALTAAAMIVAPGLIAAQYVIHNATALMFPGWVTIGSQRPRGFDATGQRLILMAGTWFVLILMVMPGGVAGLLLWLVLGPMLGPAVLVPAALVCTAALLTESVLATQALGPIYAGVDVTDVEPSE